MRGARAKKLRRAAERATIGIPNVRYANRGGTRVLYGCTREAYQALKAAPRKPR